MGVVHDFASNFILVIVTEEQLTTILFRLPFAACNLALACLNCRLPWRMSAQCKLRIEGIGALQAPAQTGTCSLVQACQSGLGVLGQSQESRVWLL